MKLKESLFCKYEKPYVNEVITHGKRLDGRGADEYRKLDLQFGKEWGVCFVTLGETKVMAQVTCEVQQPKTTRPNEGLLYLNVEISQMAAPNIEQSTLSELHVHLTRLLEKCIKESHCVDLESLCIVAEEKVWNIRVDIVVLNHDGNMAGCSSIAAIAALSHFRRPDVTIDGESVVIHTSAEKDLIPLSMRHYPVSICFAIFENGRHILSDPTDIEERTAEAELMLGMNAYRELCGMYLSGAVLQELNVVLQCAQKAAKFASTIVQQIKSAVKLDEEHKKEKTISCLVENIDVNRQLPASQSRSFLFVAKDMTDEDSTDKLMEVNIVAKDITDEDSTDKLMEVNIVAKDMTDEDSTDKLMEVNISDDDVVEIVSLGHNSAEIVEKVNLKEKKKRRRSKKYKAKANKELSSGDDDIILVETTNETDTIDVVKESKIETKIENVAYSSSDDDIACLGEITTEDRIIERIEISGDSEEEEVLTMLPTDIDKFSKSTIKKIIKPN